jgi:methionyl-tRNA synthetase
LSFIAKNCEGELPTGGKSDPADEDIRGTVTAATLTELPEAFETLALSQGIEAWLKAVFACNQYIDAQAPWNLRKSDPERMKAVLATLYAAIRDLAIAISPIIPASSARLLDQMGIPADERSLKAIEDVDSYSRLAASGFRLAAPSPIFPKLEQQADS